MKRTPQQHKHSLFFSRHAGEWELPPTEVENEGCVEAEVSQREHPPTPQSLRPPEEWEYWGVNPDTASP